MVLGKVLERTVPKCHLDPAVHPPEPRVEPGPGHRVLERRKGPACRCPRAGLRPLLRHQVDPPFASKSFGLLHRPGPADQADEYLGEQPMIARGWGFVLPDPVQNLGTPDGTPPDLAGHETSLLQAAEVRTDGIGVQVQAAGDLAHTDRPSGQPDEAVQPVSRVVGKRLVDLDRPRLRHRTAIIGEGKHGLNR